MKSKLQGDVAFTLIELLMVIAVVLALTSLLLPVISRAKTESQRGTCVSNLHQVGLAIKMYADDNKDVLPLLGQPSVGGDTMFMAFRPMVQSYLGIHLQATPHDKVFLCPADKFSVQWILSGPPDQESLRRAGPLYENTLTNFTSYCFNGGNPRANPPVPGIAGARMGSLQNPVKTVLVAEGSAFGGWSWHKPHKELLFRDSLNEVSYVDGHVDFVKIFWNGSPGVYGAACSYDPPQGYAYTWSGK